MEVVMASSLKVEAHSKSSHIIGEMKRKQAEWEKSAG